MDFKDQFTFKPRFGIVICKSWAFAVAPRHLRAHIAKRHALAASYATGLDPDDATSIAKGKAAATLAHRLNVEYHLLDPDFRHDSYTIANWVTTPWANITQPPPMYSVRPSHDKDCREPTSIAKAFQQASPQCSCQIYCLSAEGLSKRDLGPYDKISRLLRDLRTQV
jgi:hypothetical protein